MRIQTVSIAFALGLLAGGLACGPATTADPGRADVTRPDSEPRSPLGLPRSLSGGARSATLLLDRADLRLGTTVQYTRIPSLTELEDLRFVRGLNQLLITLDRWPAEYAPLAHLGRLPVEVELVVVLPGYPPDRASAEAWNLIDARARLIVVAEGPPPAGVVFDLNAMRALERVVVNTEDPTRSGFERLQRPLSFRVLRD